METVEVRPTPLYRRWPVLAGFAAVLVAAGVVLAIIAIGGDEDSSPEPTPAAAARQRLREPFESVMRERDAYFTLERQFLGVMGSATGKSQSFFDLESAYEAESDRITAANGPGYALCRTYYDIPCPDPYYPDPPQVPDFAPEILQLRDVEARLRELLASLNSQDVPDELGVLHTQLIKSVETTTTEAAHNADTLGQAATPPGKGYGTLDEGMLQTLRTDDALASIREMNVAAGALIQRLRLPLDDFDVPEGRDLDPSDHSNLV